MKTTLPFYEKQGQARNRNLSRLLENLWGSYAFQYSFSLTPVIRLRIIFRKIAALIMKKDTAARAVSERVSVPEAQQ